MGRGDCGGDEGASRGRGGEEGEHEARTYGVKKNGGT